jgi:hypothetical protein
VRNVPPGRWFRLGVLALLVPVGVQCGHALTYLFAIPDPVRRAAILSDTGHEWWEPTALIGAILAVAGILWVLVCRLRHEPGDDPWGRGLAGWLGPRLAACQLVLFAAVEVTERVLTGHPLRELNYHEIIEHGFLTQVVVALVLTMLCWCLALTVELVLAAIARPWVPLPLRRRRLILGEVACPRCNPHWPLTARAPPLAC